MNERPRYLAMLAEEDRLAGAPPRVELALRERVRAANAAAPVVKPVIKEDGWFRWRSFWAGMAVAAAVGLAVAMWMRPAPVMQELAQVASVVREQAPAPVAVQGSEESIPAASVAPLVTPRIRAAAKAAPKQAVEEPRRFYSISYAPPELLANAQIVRIRIPRSALLQFGLPLSAYRPTGGQVEADVIFTEDGIARAIRFVQ